MTTREGKHFDQPPFATHPDDDVILENSDTRSESEMAEIDPADLEWLGPEPSAEMTSSHDSLLIFNNLLAPHEGEIHVREDEGIEVADVERLYYEEMGATMRRFLYKALPAIGVSAAIGEDGLLMVGALHPGVSKERLRAAKNLIAEYAEATRPRLIEQAKREAVLEKGQFVDTKTGLLNAQGLREGFVRGYDIAATEETEGSVIEKKDLPGTGMIMIDIDLFKRINDTYNWDEGDRVIRAVGERLKKIMRHGDVVARYGGEEFVISVQHVTKEELKKISEKVQETLRFSHSVDPANRKEGAADTIDVTASIGTTFRLYQGKKDASVLFSQLFREGNAAEEHAKELGRNRIVDHTEMGTEKELLTDAFFLGRAQRKYEREVNLLSTEIAEAIQTGDRQSEDAFRKAKSGLGEQIHLEARRDYQLYLARGIRRRERMLNPSRHEGHTEDMTTDPGFLAPAAEKEVRGQVEALRALLRQHFGIAG